MDLQLNQKSSVFISGGNWISGFSTLSQDNSSEIYNVHFKANKHPLVTCRVRYFCLFGFDFTDGL